jgi:hypothetical protein
MKTGDWLHIQCPALDGNWLEKKPEYRRAGLLIDDLIKRFNLSHKDDDEQLTQSSLGDALGFTSSSVSKWIISANPVPLDHLEEIIEKLKISEDDDIPERLREVVNISNPAIRRNASMKEDTVSTSLGAQHRQNHGHHKKGPKGAREGELAGIAGRS